MGKNRNFFANPSKAEKGNFLCLGRSSPVYPNYVPQPRKTCPGRLNLALTSREKGKSARKMQLPEIIRKASFAKEQTHVLQNSVAAH
jgi:hypothetical protein